jgi:hypothetical protein
VQEGRSAAMPGYGLGIGGAHCPRSRRQRHMSGPPGPWRRLAMDAPRPPAGPRRLRLAARRAARLRPTCLAKATWGRTGGNPSCRRKLPWPDLIWVSTAERTAQASPDRAAERTRVGRAAQVAVGGRVEPGQGNLGVRLSTGARR